MPGNIQIQTTSVPVGFCFLDWQTSWPVLAGLLYANANLSVNYYKGDAPPTDLTKTWRKTIAGVPEKTYDYISGVWASEHPNKPGFTTFAPRGLTAADVDTYDGGEVGPVTAFTGPMWEIDTDFEAKFPIGPGTLESGTVISEGDTGGEEKVALKLSEIPPHHHAVLVSQSNTGGGSDVQRLRPNSTAPESDANTANAGGDSAGLVAESHNNMPPYRARFFIRRTSRTHYRG